MAEIKKRNPSCSWCMQRADLPSDECMSPVHPNNYSIIPICFVIIIFILFLKIIFLGR